MKLFKCQLNEFFYCNELVLLMCDLKQFYVYFQAKLSNKQHTLYLNQQHFKTNIFSYGPHQLRTKILRIPEIRLATTVKLIFRITMLILRNRYDQNRVICVVLFCNATSSELFSILL